jgi:hypothetical protein
MSKLEYISVSNNAFNVYAPNKNLIGQLVRLENGFFYFSTESSGGVWDGWALLDIGNMLIDLNESWSKKLDEAYKACEPSDNLDPFNDLGE